MKALLLAVFVFLAGSHSSTFCRSKSYCPYCTATKSLLRAEGVDVVVHELDRMKDGSSIQQELAQMTGQRTVPNVFINGQHLGGNDDTQRAKKTGELAKLLA